MCPDPQLLSIYLDGELPSPWKEKMESHLLQCSVCGGKLENLKRLQELLRKDTSAKRTIVDKTLAGQSLGDSAGGQVFHEPELMEEAKNKVWKRLESKQRFHIRTGLWQRRLSVPLPAAAAAAIIIMLLAALWFRGGQSNTSAIAGQQAETAERANFVFSAEDEIPGIIPAADINGVIQFLTSEGSDVIILRLPESRNFSRVGEPEIIRAADYSSRRRQ